MSMVIQYELAAIRFVKASWSYPTADPSTTGQADAVKALARFRVLDSPPP